MAIQAVTFDAYGTLLRNEDLGPGRVDQPRRAPPPPGRASARLRDS
jgi:FMN phosphatase YigB (HAD superfamily)